MESQSKAAKFAPLFIISGAACWGLIGIFTKNLTVAGCTAAQISFVRCTASAIILWLFLLIFDRQKLKIDLRDIWMFLGTGILSLVMFSVLYFRTQQTTTLSVAAVLLYTAPCFVMIMSAVLFKEKITGRKITALVLAFAGCICTTGLMETLLTGKAETVSTVSILTGVGSGFGYALYSIFGAVALKKYSSVTLTAYTMLIAALGLAPFCVRPSLASVVGQGHTILFIVGLAVISTILPYLLYTLGLKYTEPGKASVMAFSEPVVATLAGVFVFHESMTAGGAVGIILIFISIVILNYGGKQKLQITKLQNKLQKNHNLSEK